LRGVTLTLVDGDPENVWLGGRNQLIRFDPKLTARPAPPPASPVCRFARAHADGTDERLRSGDEVRVDCALPAFVDERSNRFRFRFAGADAPWSEWSSSGTRVLPRLPPGELILEIEARDALGATSAAAPLTFDVAPRWHQRAAVRAAASIGLALIVAGVVALRLRNLAARQRTLEATVAERTQELRASEAQYRRLFDNASDMIFAVDREGTIRSISPAVERILGLAPSELQGRRLDELVHPAERGRLAEFLSAAAVGDTAPILEVNAQGKGSAARVLQLTARAVPSAADGHDLEGVARDVTERRAIEEQFRQAHKMEAVGQLAGGVAHDFNNLMTVVAGHCELLLETAQGEAREGLLEIRRATARAAALTRQLLAFGGRQLLQLSPISLNDVITGLAPTLRAAIGEAIVLEVRLAPDLWPIHGDPEQVGQVLVNLASNARDAMPGGGVLGIATANVEISEAEEAPALPAGDYVLLTVSDTGRGIDAETRERIFEPFFTTKETGLGTGLGLSTVFGIVTQTGGSISVESAPGAGTRFSIHLPRSKPAALATDASSSPAVAQTPPALSPASKPARAVPASPPSSATPPPNLSVGSGLSVLVVDDEPALRKLVEAALRRHGFAVAAAGGGSEALDLAHGTRFDLLISDVVMPEMSGPEVARRLRQLQPELRVLFMTGYASPVDAGVDLRDEIVLSKPFTSASLVDALRRALERSTG
jgi:two-component system cell cycle sensor histidine kinase/response regulator CckA